MFNVFMPSSLPLLHTAMPTPCLNTFWHSDPYICLGNVFLSCIHFCDYIFWSLNIFSEDRQLHAAAANGELG